MRAVFDAPTASTWLSRAKGNAEAVQLDVSLHWSGEEAAVGIATLSYEDIDAGSLHKSLEMYVGAELIVGFSRRGKVGGGVVV
jgi:hypothetical protein